MNNPKPPAVSHHANPAPIASSAGAKPIEPDHSSRGTCIPVVDLFAGIGGLSAGFARGNFGDHGFALTGYDSEALAGVMYRDARFGAAVQQDLGGDMPIHGHYAVVLGGPPCRPWSPVNLQRRGSAHPDHRLLLRFVDHVLAIQPEIFVMENVPALRGDPLYVEGRRNLETAGYDVDARLLHYHHFGAATRRRRLFTVGMRNSGSGAREFFRRLEVEAERQPRRTVGDAIGEFRDVPRGEAPDHDWSELRSIHKYRDRYASGQFGWHKLNSSQPAPSFGSVAKTYILHPDAGHDGYPERVLSVREVLAIMGFDVHVRFPEGTARAIRYQMAANSVSPHVSSAIARVVHCILTGSSSSARTVDRPGVALQSDVLGRACQG